MSYYVIETNYTGPNRFSVNDAKNILDGQFYQIFTTPQKTNMSHEERIDGWLGATNDWSRTAHGEFATIAAAQSFIGNEIGVEIGAVRTEPATDDDGLIFPDENQIGPTYYACRANYVAYTCDYWDDYSPTAETTDAEISVEIKIMEADAKKNNVFIVDDPIEAFTDIRAELRNLDE